MKNRRLSGEVADSGESGELRRSRRGAAVGGSSGEARQNGGARAAAVAAATAAAVCGGCGFGGEMRGRGERSRGGAF